ncbi:MAG: type II/IV secretion system protein [Desulfosarcina sp.]|nr:type II/IV secretion system protein [Desulfobacterales bacterium]
MSPIDIKDPFAPKNVCRALLKRRLITKDQAKTLLQQRLKIEAELEKENRQRMASFGLKISNPITFIDVVTRAGLQRADGKPGALEEDIIFQALAAEWHIDYKKIDPLQLDLNVVTTTIPRNFAMKHLVLPIEVNDGTLIVATPNPHNMEVIDDIIRVTNMRVSTVVSSKSDILKLIDEFFGFKRSIAAAEDLFSGPSIDLGNLEQYVRLKSADELPSNDQHIVNAVNHLFIYAFDQRASDIHIEPKRETVLVRMRIDGVLHTVYKLPKKVHNAIISRIKALSRLNMAEKRRPQDGRIKMDKGGQETEIRISTVPVAFGEKVVMRVMDPDILIQDLDGLGFTENDLKKFDQFIRMPHGIILVTGPTGSGKSTTLYSSLRKISTPENNVLTVEDPIEMIHEEFNQIGVQPAIGVTFGSILKTILRQDPDIIMIGEMRDLETAENAVQASLTGHLVLSTLHTNDAPSSITRLLDLGVPPFLIQATLIGIAAQRLVRVICEYCREPFDIAASELKALGINAGLSGVVRLHRGIGCNRCRHTGYRGRLGIYEVMPYSEGIQKMTTAKANIENIRIRAKEEGMVTLRQNAIHKMLDGVTTHKEVLRVTSVRKLLNG